MPFQKGHKLNIGNKHSLGKIPWNKGLKGYTNKGSFQVGHTRSKLELNAQWKGGKRIDERGYVRLAITTNEWDYEHRIVVEKSLGRKLEYDENIHHINHDKTDNRLENLQLLSRSEHTKLHQLIKKQW